MNDLVLLTALLGGPAYGYALKKTAGLIFGGGAMHNNIVYPSLKRFVRNGWVEQTTVPGDRGQERKQYRITAQGRRHLLEQVGTFGEDEARDEGAFLLRLALFDLLPAGKRRAIVAARKSFLTMRSRELSELRDAAEPTSFPNMALSRVQQRVRDELRWIRQIEAHIETAKGGLNASK
jgi:DNA-binding PadR family transcriptional regulator